MSGYTTRLPLDTLLDTGVLYVNGTAVAATYSPSRGGLTFNPNTEIRNTEYDGKKGNVAGLDRKIFNDPSITGNLLLFRPEDFRDFEGGAQRISLPSNPSDAGQLFTPGQYISNLTLRYRRAGNGFVDLFFPLAYCRQYEISGQDRNEAEASVTFVAVQNPADLGTNGGKPPFRIDVSIELPELISTLGSDLVAIYDGRYGITLDSGVVSQWNDARGSTGFAPPMVQSTATYRPAYNAEAGELVFDGVDDIVATDLTPLFAASAASPLWGAVIGWSNPAVSGIRYLFMHTGPTSAFRVGMPVRNGTYVGFFNIGGAQSLAASGTAPAVSGRHRLAIISIAPNGLRRLRVPDNSEETSGTNPDDTIAEGRVGAGPVLASGSTEGATRAVVVGKGAFPNATQLSALRSYAIARGASMT